MFKYLMTSTALCRATILGAVVMTLQLSAADAAQLKPRNTTDTASVTFPNFIDVSACAGFSLQWSSQSIPVDHATGTFNTTWAPNEPNVLNVTGSLTATTFSANMKCPSGTGPTGTITATGSNNAYAGSYTLGGVTGPVNITVTAGGGGGGGGGGDGKGVSVDVALSPNPAKAGDTVTFKGTITPDAGHVVTATDMGTITWGDASAPVTMNALQLLPLLKSTGLTHVFTTAGVYSVHLHLFNTANPGDSGADFDYYEVVGSASVSLNEATGALVSAAVAAGGTVSLTIDATHVSGAVSATSAFEDANGIAFSNAPGPLPGFAVHQTLGMSGLAVATTQVLDANNGTLGKLRKTVGISDRLAGDPNGLVNPASTAISTTSIKGRFVFNQLQPDDVLFSGQFMLPPGFSYARSGADTMQFSMGNCVDTVHLDAKGNSARGNRMRIKKVSIKLPKLPNGVALGGEIAKVTLEYNASNLIGAGFESEGIMSSRGTTENGTKTLNRFIQLNMLFGGVAYESLIAVNYGISSKSDFGVIQGRH